MIQMINEIETKTYKFSYFFDRSEGEKDITIYADNDSDAVKKLYDQVGICEWGCLREDGTLFDDTDYLKEKSLIEKGC